MGIIYLLCSVYDDSHSSDPVEMDNSALHFLLLSPSKCSSTRRVDVFCMPRYIIRVLSCVIWVLRCDNIPIIQRV
jgi:hypothetical protein